MRSLPWQSRPNIFIYTCVYIYLYTYVNIHTCIHIHIYIRIYVRAYVLQHVIWHELNDTFVHVNCRPSLEYAGYIYIENHYITQTHTQTPSHELQAISQVGKYIYLYIHIHIHIEIRHVKQIHRQTHWHELQAISRVGKMRACDRVRVAANHELVSLVWPFVITVIDITHCNTCCSVAANCSVLQRVAVCSKSGYRGKWNYSPSCGCSWPY